MRIGHFVSNIARPAGYERSVPGHIQLALHGVKLLAEAGHEVHVITNAPGRDARLPFCMPENVRVHYVSDGRARRAYGARWRALEGVGGVRPLRAVRQVEQIRRIVGQWRIEVLHAHGYERKHFFAAGLRLLGIGCGVVGSLYAPPARAAWLGRGLLGALDGYVTGSGEVARRWGRLGIGATVVPHGLVRDLKSEVEGAPGARRHRVLFWRSAIRENGGDVCVEAFGRLAPRFPDISFDLSLRQSEAEAPRVEVPGVAALARRHGNVVVHRLPRPGVSLGRLMNEAICVLLPFRRFTIYPQLSIAESLAAGVPVVGPALAEADGLIQPGRTGLVVEPGDAAGAAEAIERLVRSPDRARAMGHEAAAAMARDWNWAGYAERMTAFYRACLAARGGPARMNCGVGEVNDLSCAHDRESISRLEPRR